MPTLHGIVLSPHRFPGRFLFASWLIVLASLGCDQGARLEGEFCEEVDCVFEATLRTADRPLPKVDLLFVVDNSASMCEEQEALSLQFSQFVPMLEKLGVDFRLAVINTDMVDVVGGVGKFRTAPGSYQLNAPACSQPNIDLSECQGQSFGPVLSRDAYLGPNQQLDTVRLARDFRCLGLVGIDGDSVEMGLATMHHALIENSTQSADFPRPGAVLAVLFLTDENDCSDGTLGSQKGPVYPLADAGCEYNRNIEDSCLYAASDQGITLGFGPLLEDQGQAKHARHWCVDAEREAVERLASQLELRCPTLGCQNLLLPRKQFYDALLHHLARRHRYCLPARQSECSGDMQSVPDDALDLQRAALSVVVAAFINPDNGIRPIETEELPTQVCEQPGTRGYRYQAFAEMFPQSHRVVSPICEEGSGAHSFVDAFAALSLSIGVATGATSVCLPPPPRVWACDGECYYCCPTQHPCGSAVFADAKGEYRSCSGFAVEIRIDEGLLEQGKDYVLALDSSACPASAPFQLSFDRALQASTAISVQYRLED